MNNHKGVLHFEKGGKILVFRRRYKSRKKILLFALLCLFSILILFNSLFKMGKSHDIDNIPSLSLELYFTLEENIGIKWYYFAAMDIIERNWSENIEEKKYEKIAILYTKNQGDINKTLRNYKSKRYAKKVIKKSKKLSEIDQIYRNKQFPIPKDVAYHYENGWGDDRTYGGDRKHEGIDLIADKGTPVYSVGNGKIENVGWNELGGWRVGITGEDGIYYYYAHLDRYGKNIKQGKNISGGEIIGYVGNTGYGPEGTEGKFVDHLHFGMYQEGEAINPYPFLKGWEIKQEN